MAKIEELGGTHYIYDEEQGRWIDLGSRIAQMESRIHDLENLVRELVLKAARRSLTAQKALHVSSM